MPNPTVISLLNYHFEAKASDTLLTVMLNYSDIDYSIINELCDFGELSPFTFEEVRTAVQELNRRGFLLTVKKPYGSVYTVSKLQIPNMMFDYS